jgi:hypothetical protein
MVNEILFTGNLLIDFVNPLFTGNFNILSGSFNMGQKILLNSTAYNFASKQIHIKNSKEINIDSKEVNDSNTNFLIYITYSNKEALKLQENLNLKQQQISDKLDNFIIFSLSETPNDSEYYYLPRFALNYAKKLINSNPHINILFCFDDISTYMMKERNLFQTAKSFASSRDILADIREECGNFSSHTFTALLNAEKNKTQIEFETFYEKQLNNILSYTDKVLKLDTNIKLLRSK